jgi:hypothetical protein
MIGNRMQDLHEKATRGTILSTAEQAELDAWYAAQDAAESQLLEGTAPSQGLDALQKDVQVAVAQLQAVTLRIQVLSEQNEALRQEVTALQRQLAQRTPRAA